MIDFVLANSADPDEIPLYVGFYLGLQCLPKYLFRVSGPQRVGSRLCCLIVILSLSHVVSWVRCGT